ncbi:MAG: hypothetical protein HYV27_17370 [Candidatus Hydrogenedentes bacterium]|nr:hypothetical protein [Candidatus Hydrogenedentota bacterium]
MTIVGVVLAVAGFAAYGLLFTGNAPEFISSLPMPLLGWLALGVAGLIVIMLNRRPAN